MSENAHLVFISHASEDKALANEVCAALEKAGVRCWIAPRDIRGGSNWAKSIIDAIKTTRLMVLVFSRHTARSQHVRREIERAVHRNVSIIPLRTENIMPEGDLEYFLSSQHWIDLFPGPVEKYLPTVQSTVRSLIGVKSAQKRRPEATSAPPTTAEATGKAKTASVEPTATSAPPRAAKLKPAWLVAAGSAVVIGLLAIGGFLLLHSRSPGSTSSTDDRALDAAAKADTIDTARASLPAIEQALAADPSSEKLQSLSQRLHSMSDAASVLKFLGVELVKIEPGDFEMGSPVSEPDRRSDEVQHRVKLDKPYFIAKTEVTQAQWRKVMNESFKDHCVRAGQTSIVGEGDDDPMYFVSWAEAEAFCKKLSQLTGNHIRLPSESEWEFACRAGSTSAYFFGEDAKSLTDYAWFANNSGSKALDFQKILATDEPNAKSYLLQNDCRVHPVAQKKPNPCGLYDVCGNVWEWCDDEYKPYPGGPPAPSAANKHIARGGAWSQPDSYCRSAMRYAFGETHGNTIGFRIAADAK